MEKLKNVGKGGWKPSGDRPIHRETWKSDLKGMATGKKQDPYAYARDHQSAPLGTLKDPDSFGPPPKHKEFYPDGQSPNQSSQAERWTARTDTGLGAGVSDGPSGGLGSVVPVKTRQQREEEAARKKAEEDAPKRPSGPFQIDSTGLRTDNLPKPPVRRNGPDSPATVMPSTATPRTAAPVPLPPRNNTVSLPPRQNARPGAPPPVLPPRQNEYPDEHTPAPPPPYHEAMQQPSQPVPAINHGAINRLGQAGVSVPGLGIGGHSETTASAASHAPQVSELQQRFARMNTSAAQQTPHAVQPRAHPSGAAVPAAVVAKKGPPPPPPKKISLSASTDGGEGNHATPQPPPLPLSSKPRPT